MGKTNNFRTKNPDRNIDRDDRPEEYGIRERRTRKRGGARNFTREVLEDDDYLEEDDYA